MCGLFGVHTEDLDLKVATVCNQSLSMLSHRGPDHSEFLLDKNSYVGHTRLSILDLSLDGVQPMSSKDGNVIISVNGEIYNYLELKKELKETTFKSKSDSEILLHGYIEWGIDKLLSKIEGMYSFVIYDKRINKIYLVRDRVGIKPLFYSIENGGIAWSSELKPLFHFLSETGNVTQDPLATYDFLTYQYIPAPNTLYKEISKLEPAHCIEYCIQTKKVSKTCYWNLKVSEKEKSLQEASKKALELLKNSVSMQMVSDVKVGFFLSGGIDSGTVVALASELNHDFKTFSIGFNEATHDESIYAKEIAKKYEIENNLKFLSKDAAPNLSEFLWDMFHEPFADSSAWPTFEVAKLATSECKVVLTGDGGDELFGGYRWYTEFNRIRKIQRPIIWLSNILGFEKGFRTNFERFFSSRFKQKAKFLDRLTYSDPLELYSLLLGGCPWSVKKKYRKLLNIPEQHDDLWYFRKHYYKKFGEFKSLQYLDFHTYLHNDILTKVDRASMANSLEARVPFLDTTLVEYCFSLDEKILIGQNELKMLLKYSAKELLPENIIKRGKRGFSIPLLKWRKRVLNGNVSIHEHLLKDLVR